MRSPLSQSSELLQPSSGKAPSYDFHARLLDEEGVSTQRDNSSQMTKEERKERRSTPGIR